VREPTVEDYLMDIEDMAKKALIAMYRHNAALRAENDQLRAQLARLNPETRP
jgi:regulator of replication initiation timing